MRFIKARYMQRYPRGECWGMWGCEECRKGKAFFGRSMIKGKRMSMTIRIFQGKRYLKKRHTYLPFLHTPLRTILCYRDRSGCSWTKILIKCYRLPTLPTKIQRIKHSFLKIVTKLNEKCDAIQFNSDVMLYNSSTKFSMAKKPQKTKNSVSRRTL